MATYVEVNGMKYPASITGMLRDPEWNNRESKSIKMEISYQEALEIFTEDISWNIIQETECREVDFNENGEQIIKTVINTEFYDNSDFCMAGSVTDHRNGMVTIKMGKPTAEELLSIFEEVLQL